MNNSLDNKNILVANQPKYVTIRNYLYGLIKDNADNPDFLLPSENAIMIKFNVSRITAKQAFTQLEKEGLILRIQGKGTFANTKISTTISNSFSSFSNVIGVILPDLKSTFTSHLIEGIEKYARSNGYMTLISNSNFDQNIEASTIRKYYEMGVAGMLIYPVAGQNFNKEILRLSLKNYPLVFLDRKLNGVDIPTISSDHFHAAKMLTEHLISMGHTKIGFVTMTDNSTSTVLERIEGYKFALENKGLRFINKRVTSNILLNDTAFKEKMDEYMEQNQDVTAFIAIDGGMGKNTLCYLLSKNVKVPEEVAVASFDNEYGYWDDIVKCPITCAAQDTINIGKLGAKLLLQKIKEPNCVLEDIMLKTHLMIKQSTNYKRTSD